MSYRFFLGLMVLVASVALLLSTAGIYALMSFIVSQRTREIGIHAALGANPRRIVGAIFSQALVQLGVGVLGGVALLAFVMRGEPVTWDALGPVVAVAGLMMVVGLFACVIPALRALRIQPTEALRSGG